MSKNTIKTVVLLAFIGGLFMLIGEVLGGGNGLIIAFFIAIAFVGFQYWMSDKLAIKAAHAVPVSEEQMPQYYAIVRDLTQRAGLPMPKLYVTPDMQPNAFATGRNPEHAAVAVTRGILEICTWDEMATATSSLRRWRPVWRWPSRSSPDSPCSSAAGETGTATPSSRSPSSSWPPWRRC
jgi:Zn-dependent protease with chaperone function